MPANPTRRGQNYNPSKTGFKGQVKERCGALSLIPSALEFNVMNSEKVLPETIDTETFTEVMSIDCQPRRSLRLRYRPFQGRGEKESAGIHGRGCAGSKTAPTLRRCRFGLCQTVLEAEPQSEPELPRPA